MNVIKLFGNNFPGVNEIFIIFSSSAILYRVERSNFKLFLKTFHYSKLLKNGEKILSMTHMRLSFAHIIKRNFYIMFIRKT